MKVSEINISNKSKKPVFTSIYTNKAAKKIFKFADENAPVFIAGTTAAMSMVVRPLVVMATPDTDKENKRYAAVKSIASGLTGLAIMFLVSKPLNKAISKIDKNPQNFLKKETIKNLKEGNLDLKNSKPYITASQLLKLGTALVVAIPKACLTAALITPLFAKFWEGKNKKDKKTQNVNFKGHYLSKMTPDFFTKQVAKFYNSDFIQKFSNKIKNSNFEMVMISLTDIFAAGSFIIQNNKNKNIEEKRKKVLHNNVIYSTALTILGAFALDKLLCGKTQKFIDNFKSANPNLKDVEKYVEGIKITKKVFILGGLYYVLIPFLATFFADKTPSEN